MPWTSGQFLLRLQSNKVPARITNDFRQIRAKAIVIDGAFRETQALVPAPDIDEMAGDRGSRRHLWRHQMGAALIALAAFEVPV